MKLNRHMAFGKLNQNKLATLGNPENHIVVIKLRSKRAKKSSSVVRGQSYELLPSIFPTLHPSYKACVFGTFIKQKDILFLKNCIACG